MRRSSLFALMFIIALSAFSYGAVMADGDDPSDDEEKEAVENFTVDDVKYHVTDEGVVEVEGVEDAATSIVIPKEVTFEETKFKVTAITEDAFSGNTKLTSVNICGGVKEIL